MGVCGQRAEGRRNGPSASEVPARTENVEEGMKVDKIEPPGQAQEQGFLDGEFALPCTKRGAQTLPHRGGRRASCEQYEAILREIVV